MTILLSSVRKTYGAHAALDSVSLTIGTGEFFVVLGPSGCGKSTLLRAIAGLERIDGGEIMLGDVRIAGDRLHVAPEHRNVGVVFQSYALWPHMSVAGNVGFPLETAGRPRAEIRGRIAQCLATVELTDYADRKPADLSGGQRQRVALARCLAQGARTVLMDEPLANLDPHLRHTMEGELAAFHRESGATTLFITHDQREAMALADRVAVMWDSQILQVDDPDTLYRRPASRRVAGFIGRGTVLPVSVARVDGTRARIVLGGQWLEVDCPAGARPGPAFLLLRPEHVVPATDGPGVAGRVERLVYRGGFWDAFVSLDGVETQVMMTLAARLEPGETLPVKITRGWLLPGD